MCSMLTGRAEGHMSSALCVTAGEQESQDGRQPAAFHQEFLKNTRERGRSEERLTPVAPAGSFSPAPWQVVRGHHRDFHTHTHTLAFAAGGDEVTAVALLLCWRPELKAAALAADDDSIEPKLDLHCRERHRSELKAPPPASTHLMPLNFTMF